MIGTAQQHTRHCDQKTGFALLSVGRWARWNPPRLLALAGIRERARVLDLGCGSGFWTTPIGAIVGPRGRVVALDACQELLDLLNSRAPLPCVRTTQCELPRISLPDSSVDFVWAAFVLHEVDALSTLTEEVLRVLRPGGCMAVLEWQPDAAAEDAPPREVRLPLEQVIQALRDAGFQDVQCVWQDSDGYLAKAGTLA